VESVEISISINLTKVRKVRKIELSQRAIKEKESKMNTFILQEQLKEKLISYLSTLDGIDLDDDKSNVLKDIRQIVFDTFQEREV
jgi:DNA-binding protein Fis